MDRKAIRIKPDGSQENVSWIELKVGDVVEEDGVRKRIALKEVWLEDLTTGRFQFRGGDKWYAVANRGVAGEGNFYRPVDPPNAPFGELAGKWDIAPVATVNALTFEDVQ